MSSKRYIHVTTGALNKAGPCPMDSSQIRLKPSQVHNDSQGSSKDMWSPCSDCSSDENNSPTALNSFRWDKPAMEDKSLSDFGNWTVGESAASVSNNMLPQDNKRPISSGYVNLQTDSEEDEVKACTSDISQRQRCQKIEESLLKKENTEINVKLREYSTKSECFPNNALEKHFENSERKHFSSISDLHSSDSFITSVPSASESENSISIKHKRDMEDLKKVAWFQAGIPREIALEVLSSKPIGSFIVRESTTKPGCYALSLRIPPGKNPTNIAHYLILHTNRGYKIKGFTKEFQSLEALITHHSVMPELLPCPLALPRFHHHKNHSRRQDDLELLPDEEEEEKRCSVFSDIHWLMTDLHL